MGAEPVTDFSRPIRLYLSRFQNQSGETNRAQIERNRGAYGKGAGSARLPNPRWTRFRVSLFGAVHRLYAGRKKRHAPYPTRNAPPPQQHHPTNSLPPHFPTQKTPTKPTYSRP